MKYQFLPRRDSSATQFDNELEPAGNLDINIACFILGNFGMPNLSGYEFATLCHDGQFL